MANFVISNVVSTISSKKQSLLNTFKDNPIYSLFDNERDIWKKDKISPRLSDLTVQKSGYNDVIPNVYGTNRIAGNIIWASKIKEVENSYTTTYSTGKGGKKVHQNNIEYFYYANVAIAICAGEVNEIKRVWADTDLINLDNYNYRFYSGNEEQMPDSLIESFEGIGNVPAYRGLCYVVFENLPLVEFGNRIPNFTFEVYRNYASADDVENIIGGVNIIPGCGEFVYDTEVISKQNGVIWYDEWHPTGETTRINQNSNEKYSDSVVATKQLRDSLPNCKWAAPVVSWFGDSLNIADCKIEPKVEFKLNPNYETQITTPDVWMVAGIDRKSANIVGNDDGKIRYGGTISDNSIVRYLKHLKNEGFSVMFYPMIFMDIENKPWRGYLSGEAENVENFFTKADGYNHFILHYAELVKDYVDAFIIGSELRELTKIYKSEALDDGTITRTFPAVDCFVNLAKSVKQIVGNIVKVGYAADWSEYHHTDGGWYNMDKLWASEYIDFVGIDAYFPLTDKKESLITKQDIKDGWFSGEGYDWIYRDENRTQKENIDAKWAWKNIEYWWSNEHINPDGQKTEWVPRGKKIWFTEYGFASIDGTTNEPNKFYDSTSLDGGIPRFSDGKVNYFAQRKAIQATEEVWKDSKMVENKFVWCWDARPYPFFPNKINVWSDGNNWHYGHWINGKLGSLMFYNMIKMIFNDANIDFELIGDIDIYESIDGIVLNNRISVNEVLNILQKAFFFDYYENDGKLYIVAKKNQSSLRIADNELVEIEKDIYIKTNIIGENELPYKVDLSYINKDLNYQISNTYCERRSMDSYKRESESLPVVINPNRAKQIAEKLLYSMWLERIIYNFKLPPKYLFLNPADIITLNIDGTDIALRIMNTVINPDNTINIKAVKSNDSLYNFDFNDDRFENIETILPSSKTDVEIFELPAISNTETPEVFLTTNGSERGWSGCGIYLAKHGSSSFNFMDESRNNSIVGTCLNPLGNARPYYLDYENELYIAFNSNINTDILESIDMFDLLDGANMAKVGEEIIQFQKVELQNDGIIKISHLLRGQFGTETSINSHKSNEKFIFLNQFLVSKKFTNNDLSTIYDFKIITFKDSFENSVDLSHKITGRNLQKMKPVHVKCKKLSNGDYEISWIARNRGIYGWKDGEEVVGGKEFLVEIVDEKTDVLVRSSKVLNNIFIYTKEMMAEDKIEKFLIDIKEL